MIRVDTWTRNDMKWVHVKGWGCDENPYGTWFDVEIRDYIPNVIACIENLLKAGGYKFWTITVDV